MIQNLVLQCPTCKQPVHWNATFPHRPFCSERCQKIDFGEWAAENHRIRSEPDLHSDLGEEYEDATKTDSDSHHEW